MAKIISVGTAVIKLSLSMSQTVSLFNAEILILIKL